MYPLFYKTIDERVYVPLHVRYYREVQADSIMPEQRLDGEFKGFMHLLRETPAIKAEVVPVTMDQILDWAIKHDEMAREHNRKLHKYIRECLITRLRMDT